MAATWLFFPRARARRASPHTAPRARPRAIDARARVEMKFFHGFVAGLALVALPARASEVDYVEIDASALARSMTRPTPILAVADVLHTARATMEAIGNFAAPGPTPPRPHERTKPYGDPAKGPCLPREAKVQIRGVDGDFCSPSCSVASPCPEDPYKGAVAKAACVLQTPGSGGPDRCALVCDPRASAPNGGCPRGSSCQPVAQVGICTYPM